MEVSPTLSLQINAPLQVNGGNWALNSWLKCNIEEEIYPLLSYCDIP